MAMPLLAAEHLTLAEVGIALGIIAAACGLVLLAGFGYFTFGDGDGDGER